MTWCRNRVAALLAVTMLLFSQAVAEEFSYPSTLSLEQVRRWIDRCDVGHPRLLTNREELAQLRSTVDQDPLAQALARGIVNQAEVLREMPPITRTLQGRRLLGQSRACVQRLLSWAMAYHLTGERKYAQRAEQEMLAVAAFSDWNPSHFLDVAEMTFGMAVGYDWLFHELDASNREVIRAALVDKGVALPFNSSHNGWVKARNNWGQVCHGGLTAGALAVLEDEPEWAAKTVHNALQNVHHSMHAYGPHGSYPEGPGYWVYGTSYNVLLIAVLESALGSDFGLTQAPGFPVTGQFPALTCGPSGQYFNYADGGSGRGAEPILFWFAQRFQRPDWLWGERELWQSVIARLRNRSDATRVSRLAPLVLLWWQPEPENIAMEMPLHWQGQGEVPITLHRSSWTDPHATFVGFKGGSPSANHGQMDIGSFVLDADGVRWGLDLGAEGYHGIESRGMNLWNSRQDSDRWTIFRQSNFGHNTLVISEQLQRAAGQGRFVAFSDRPAFAHSVLDMSDVYQGQAQSVLRGVALLPSGEVLIRDEIIGLPPDSVVRWGMITPSRVETNEGQSIQLSQGDARLQLQLVAPDNGTWQQFDTATPRNAWDSPNRSTCMVAFESAAPASGDLTFMVLVTPGSCQQSALEELPRAPLAEWDAK